MKVTPPPASSPQDGSHLDVLELLISVDSRIFFGELGSCFPGTKVCFLAGLDVLGGDVKDILQYFVHFHPEIWGEENPIS